MSMFFIVMGVTAGIFVGSFILGRCRLVSVFIPSLVSVVVTMLMYVGELILLQGNLYRFGKGMIFEGIDALVLAPVDIAVIILSGAICGFIFFLLSKKKI